MALASPEPIGQEQLDEWEQQLEDATAAALRRAANRMATNLESNVPAGVAASGQPGEPFISLDDLALLTAIWGGLVVASLLPMLAGIYTSSSILWAASFGDLLPDAKDLLIPDSNREDSARAQFLAGAQVKLERISAFLRMNARSSLEQGIIDGETIPELAARVRAVAGQSEKQSFVTARTLAIGAANAASLQTALKLKDASIIKEWISTDDERVRPTHWAANGQRVPILDVFNVGAAHLMFPGDPTGPPEEVFNCRCAIGYVLDVEPAEVTITAAATTDPSIVHESFCRNPLHPGPCKGYKRKGKTPEVDTPNAPNSPDVPASKPSTRRKNTKSPDVPGASFEDRVKEAKQGPEALKAAPIRDDRTLRAKTTRQEEPYPGAGYKVEENIDLNGVDGNKVRESVAGYSDQGYQYVNWAMRHTKGKVDAAPESMPNGLHYSKKRVTDLAEGIDAAMKSSKLSDSVYVHRGISDPKRTFGSAWQENGSNVGMEWIDDAYDSTTTRETTARRFAGNGAGVKMNILVPKGVSAIGIENSQPGLKGEQELVLDRGLRYRVVADREDNGVRTLDVEVMR